MVSEWNKKHVFDIVGTMQNSIFKEHRTIRMKLLTSFRFGLSHWKEHKFKHNLKDSMDSLACVAAVYVSSLSLISYSVAQIISLKGRHFLIKYAQSKKRLLKSISQIKGMFISALNVYGFLFICCCRCCCCCWFCCYFLFLLLHLC